MNNSIKKIVIVGADITGLTAAVYLSSQLKGMGLTVEVLDCAEINKPKVISTSPQANQYFQAMGFNMQNMISQTDATFSLGSAFIGWQSADSFAFNSYSQPPEIAGFFDFQHFWVKAKLAGTKHSYHEYSLSASAAKQAKFALPSPQNNHPLAQMAFGINFDAELLHEFMQHQFSASGIGYKKGAFERVNFSEDGTITSIQLAGLDEPISGDFFIDCSGDQALLIDQYKQSVKTNPSNLKEMRSASMLVESKDSELRPQQTFMALPQGYLRECHLQNKMALNFVFNSSQVSDGDVTLGLKQNTQNATSIDIESNDLKFGIRNQFWVENCLAIGSSAYQFPEFDYSEYSYVFNQLQYLVDLFPHAKKSLNATVYNQQVTADIMSVNDFSLLPLVLNQRDGKFWDELKKRPLFSDLKHRLKLFENSGRLTESNDSFIPKYMWASMLIGQGAVPKTYHPLLDELGESNALDKMRKQIDSLIDQMPTHKTFLSQFCK